MNFGVRTPQKHTIIEMRQLQQAWQTVMRSRTNPKRKRETRDSAPSLARRVSVITGCWATALVMLSAGTVVYGQTSPFGDSNQTVGGTFGFGRDVGGGLQGASGGRGAPAGLNRIDRNASSGSRSGMKTGSDAAAGTTQRIDRSRGAAASNPLAPRGMNVRAGDATQEPGILDGGVRLPAVTDSFQSQAPFDPSLRGRVNDARGRTEWRPQYAARTIFGAPAPATQRDGRGSPLDTATAIQGALSGLSPVDIDVRLDGSTVVLRGTLACESDRRVAELTAKLEPGVRRVRNELVVAAPADEHQ